MRLREHVNFVLRQAGHPEVSNLVESRFRKRRRGRGAFHNGAKPLPIPQVKRSDRGDDGPSLSKTRHRVFNESSEYSLRRTAPRGVQGVDKKDGRRSARPSRKYVEERLFYSEFSSQIVGCPDAGKTVDGKKNNGRSARNLRLCQRNQNA